MRKVTLEEKLERFPPCVCRMLARTGSNNRSIGVLEDEELAERAEMSVSEVRSLSWLTSWDKVTNADFKSFTKACGVDFSSRESLAKHYKYTQLKRPFGYLRSHPEWDSWWSKMFHMYSTYLMDKYGE